MAHLLCSVLCTNKFYRLLKINENYSPTIERNVHARCTIDMRDLIVIDEIVCDLLCENEKNSK